MASTVRPIAVACLFVAYPFLSTYLAKLGFAHLELLVFAGLTLWRGLAVKSWAIRIVSLLVTLILLASAYFATIYMVWLLPALVYLWLTALFGHTLWSPPPLLERLVRLQFPEFQPGIAEYLRQLTWVWTWFFAINVPICALLPLLAGQTAWALYTGVIVYLLMAILGVGEWFYRHHRFPDLEIPPAMETFQVMLRNSHKLFKDD